MPPCIIKFCIGESSLHSRPSKNFELDRHKSTFLYCVSIYLTILQIRCVFSFLICFTILTRTALTFKKTWKTACLKSDLQLLMNKSVSVSHIFLFYPFSKMLLTAGLRTFWKVNCTANNFLVYQIAATIVKVCFTEELYILEWVNWKTISK